MVKATGTMKIISENLDISISEILQMIKICDISIPSNLDCAEDWERSQKKAYVESLILGFPSPSFIFTIDKEQILEIIDGVKRIKAIIDFINNEFSIHPKIEGYEVKAEQCRRFNELNRADQQRLLLKTLLFSKHTFENQVDAKISLKDCTLITKY